ncbi:MAG: zinc ribbon domain-containing protein [Gemmatimonadaceae bacterium]
MTDAGDAPVKQQPAFCPAFGTRLLEDARFCQSCGTPTREGASAARTAAPWPPAVRWGLPIVGFGALIALSAIQLSREAKDDPQATMLAGGIPMGAPDISAMSPAERADRLFNRVMSLSSAGKTDSAAFFAPMAINALESLAPLSAHGRYDIGLVALATGDLSRAAAQADTILAQRSTHLLGLALAARAAEARGDVAAARSFQQRMLAAERSELDQPLQEYTDHNTDILDAIGVARSRRQ